MYILKHFNIIADTSEEIYSVVRMVFASFLNICNMHTPGVNCSFLKSILKKITLISDSVNVTCCGVPESCQVTRSCKFFFQWQLASKCVYFLINSWAWYMIQVNIRLYIKTNKMIWIVSIFKLVGKVYHEMCSAIAQLLHYPQDNLWFIESTNFSFPTPVRI